MGNGMKGLEINDKILGINDDGKITVDGVPLSGGTPVTVENGLRDDSGTIKLGGDITEDTTITIDDKRVNIVGKDETGELWIGGAEGSSALSTLNIGATDVSIHAGDEFTAHSNVDATLLADRNALIIGNDNVVLIAPEDKAQIAEQPTGANELAIATTKYVDDKAGVAAENGLNLTAGKIKLGGALTEDTNIDCDGKTLIFENGNDDYSTEFKAGADYFGLHAKNNDNDGTFTNFGVNGYSINFVKDGMNAGYFGYDSEIQTAAGEEDMYGETRCSVKTGTAMSRLKTVSPGCTLSLELHNKTISISGSGSEFVGMQYASDYTTRFEDYSLVSKRYVNGRYVQEDDKSTYTLIPNEKKIFRILLNQNANLTINTNNIATGEWGTILVVQDDTGDRELTFDSVFKKNGSTVNSDANKTTVIKYLVISEDEVLLEFAYSY